MIQEEQQEGIFDNDLQEADKIALLEISKWTRVIAAIGFAITAMLVLSMLLGGAGDLKKQAALPGARLSYPVLVLNFFINFFAAAIILYHLHKSSNLILTGVQQQNHHNLSRAFTHLKNFFIALIVFACASMAINLLNIL